MTYDAGERELFRTKMKASRPDAFASHSLFHILSQAKRYYGRWLSLYRMRKLALSFETAAVGGVRVGCHPVIIVSRKRDLHFFLTVAIILPYYSPSAIGKPEDSCLNRVFCKHDDHAQARFLSSPL